VSANRPGRRKSGGGHEEEHENHERWLVSYADMMTLLMVLFIVMFAISAVDAKKFAALKTGLTAGFGAPIEMLAGGDSMLEPGGAVAPDSVNLHGAAQGKTNQTPIDPAQVVDPETVAQLAKSQARANAAEEAKHLKKVRKQLEQALAKAGLRNGATFRFDERGLIVTIATDDVLFGSGSAVLRDQGRRILAALAPTLRRVPNRITVDGHTNWLPISTAQYPSNWELSADRASHVLRYLVESKRLDPKRISATAYADTQPLLPRSDPDAVRKNRRVEIVIVAQLDDDARRALAELANDAPLRPPSDTRSGSATPSGNSGRSSESSGTHKGG
jgi:chemotaxis protein MotB